MRLCWDLTCDPGSAAKYATDCPMELDLQDKKYHNYPNTYRIIS